MVGGSSGQLAPRPELADRARGLELPIGRLPRHQSANWHFATKSRNLLTNTVFSLPLRLF